MYLKLLLVFSFTFASVFTKDDGRIAFKEWRSDANDQRRKEPTNMESSFETNDWLSDQYNDQNKAYKDRSIFNEKYNSHYDPYHRNSQSYDRQVDQLGMHGKKDIEYVNENKRKNVYNNEKHRITENDPISSKRVPGNSNFNTNLENKPNDYHFYSHPNYNEANDIEQRRHKQNRESDKSNKDKKLQHMFNELNEKNNLQYLPQDNKISIAEKSSNIKSKLTSKNKEKYDDNKSNKYKEKSKFLPHKNTNRFFNDFSYRYPSYMQNDYQRYPQNYYSFSEFNGQPFKKYNSHVMNDWLPQERFYDNFDFHNDLYPNDMNYFMKKNMQENGMNSPNNHDKDNDDYHHQSDGYRFRNDVGHLHNFSKKFFGNDNNPYQNDFGKMSYNRGMMIPFSNYKNQFNFPSSKNMMDWNRMNEQNWPYHSDYNPYSNEFFDMNYPSSMNSPNHFNRNPINKFQPFWKNNGDLNHEFFNKRYVKSTNIRDNSNKYSREDYKKDNFPKMEDYTKHSENYDHIKSSLEKKVDNYPDNVQNSMNHFEEHTKNSKFDNQDQWKDAMINQHHKRTKISANGKNNDLLNSNQEHNEADRYFENKDYSEVKDGGAERVKISPKKVEFMIKEKNDDQNSRSSIFH